MKGRLLALLLLPVLMASCNPFELAKIAARYYAKEICSCIFVVEQTLSYCQNAYANEATKDYPLTLDIDRSKGTVSAEIATASARAQWLGLYQGCRLDADQEK